jgi:peptide/nickel transport system substrate-binding protein
MKLNSRTKFGVVVAASALLLSACGGGGSSAGGTGTPTKGGTITYLTIAEQFNHVDPQRNYTGQDLAFFGGYVNRTLTSYAHAEGPAGAELVADMATDTGTTTDGGKTWSFTLRDGLTWEDGSEVTCQDVAYGVSRVFATDIIVDGPTYAISYLDIPAGDEGSNYPGPYKATAEQQALYDNAVSCADKTITFKLNKVVADFNYTVTLLAFAPVPKAKDTGEKYDDAVVSNGPYKIESYVKAQSMTLVRNENWNPDSDPIRKAYPDKVVVNFAQDQAVIDSRLIASAGDDAFAVSMDGIQPENLPTVFGDDQFKDRRVNETDPYAIYTAINVKKVNCLPVRKALFLALDREALRAVAGGEYVGDFADGFISPTLALDYAPNTLPEGVQPAGNPEAAKALMEEAKTACPDVYAKATGEGLVFDHPDTPTWAKNVAVWIESEKAAGIVIKSNPIEPGKYYSVVMDPALQGDISRSGWAADWLNASTVMPELFGEGGFNISQNQEDAAFPAYKALMDEALAQTDRAAQADLWKKANQYALDQVWAIPSWFGRSQEFRGSKIGGGYLWYPFGSHDFASLYVIQ